MRHRQTDRELSGAPRRRGFTLVELLVVVAIIALLVSILLPTLSRAKELGRRAVCSANLHAVGLGWAVYFNESNNRTPNQFNPRRDVSDSSSQFNYLIWCRAGAGGPAYTNAGALYKKKAVGTGNVYVCPTIGATKNPWFSSLGGGWSSAAVGANPWPVIDGSHTRMTYGTRRTNYYDDPNVVLPYNLGGAPNSAPVCRDDPAKMTGYPGYYDKHPQIWTNSQGVASVKVPAGFSFMADCFADWDKARLSHMPGVNVLSLDWHVSFYEDPRSEVLYTLDPTNSNGDTAWKHDDIWMIIDGYHTKALGLGQGITVSSP